MKKLKRSKKAVANMPQSDKQWSVSEPYSNGGDSSYPDTMKAIDKQIKHDSKAIRKNPAKSKI